MIDRILSQHAYPEHVAAMLGEAITLAVLLAGALKYDGVFTLQTKGDGPIRMIVADVSTDGAVRGYAQYDQSKLDAVATSGATADLSVPRLLGAGYIAFTVDQGEEYSGKRTYTAKRLRNSCYTMSRTDNHLIDGDIPQRQTVRDPVSFSIEAHGRYPPSTILANTH